MDADSIEWISSNVLPHEAELRAMLRRVCNSPEDVDDVVQEVYHKTLLLTDLDQIREPKAFLKRMAKNIVIDRMRRDAVVRIEAVANLEDLAIDDMAPSPERIAMARAELKWVFGLIANLPGRCREVIKARRVFGLSQNETAESLGMSVGMVEQETMRGMTLISEMIANVGVSEQPGRGKVRKTKRAVNKSNVND